MSLSARELSKLKQIVALAEDIIAKAEAAPVAKVVARKGSPTRTRRSGKELLSFRKMLKAERKRGVPVTELAMQHGISTAYIYSL